MIKGFDEAWADFNTPVFTGSDHPSWKSNDHKYTRWLGNFTNGDAYFCIPQYPFAGEGKHYYFWLNDYIFVKIVFFLSGVDVFLVYVFNQKIIFFS